ncbi:hypothetical protein CR513_16096, partial [Mucuna pruriens]
MASSHSVMTSVYKVRERIRRRMADRRLLVIPASCKRFKALVEAQSGCILKKLRRDNGKEYTSAEFDVFCDDLGGEHQLTVRYSLQQNGNKLPTKAVKGMTPIEAWGGIKPSDKHLRTTQVDRHSVLSSLESTNEDQEEEVDDDFAVRGTRPLSDIYLRCNTVVFEPTSFEDVSKVEE